MTPQMAARRCLIVILTMMVIAGVWSLLMPFSVSSPSGFISCSVPLDAMRDPSHIIYQPGDRDYSDRQPCVAEGRNRVSAGFMLLVAAGIGGLLTFKIFGEHAIDYVPAAPSKPKSKIDD